MAVKILEVCKVTPPPGSPTNASLNLTFFDLFWLRAPPVEQLFFYETREPLVSASTLVLSLKLSLSLTLKHFLPLAGNLTWSPSSPNPIIRYETGDGISFTVAESDDDFYSLSGKNLRKSRIFQPLIAHMVGSESRSPLYAVKVTIFPNKGFCIGITQHHGAGDGNTFSLFFKSWALISKFGDSGSLSTELTPVFDRESVRERFAELENLYIEILRKQNGNKLAVWELESPDLVRATFVLSDLEVSNLKALVSARVANYEHNREVTRAPYVSTFTVMYAYVILCLVKAKTRANNIVLVTFVSDCRSRLEPPLSANYIGNCVCPCDIYFNIDELLGRDGFMMIVNAISTSIKDLDNNRALRGAEEWLTDMIEQVADTELWMISVAGSTRYEFQNIDFGWGKPRKADITSIDKTGAVTFTEAEDGGKKGIEVELSLSKAEMDKFASIFRQGLGKMMKCKLAAL